ncbi:hypothetical protein [Sphingopyxis sp. 2PD]|uniref:hypothetical protein n=1 Tax=Sphingopyxis sp. 2PD TaxID=2502196 RepID=UPI0010F9E670|nr:hypothetical protein [Sphingopyxis sp. 2PD]
MTVASGLRKSSIWAIAEVVVTGIGLFAILKIILAKLGTDALGIWSLVVATTILLRVGDASIAAVVPRFVGESYALGRTDEAREFADTALITSFALHLVVAVILYFPLILAIETVVPANAKAEATQLLPFAIVAFVILSVAQTALAVVVGVHRAYAKSILIVAAMPLQLAMVWFLSDQLGLVAVVLAQACQSAFLIVAARMYCTHVFGQSPSEAFRFHWRRARFRAFYGIGLKMQVTQIASLAFDPLIKFTLSATFGLHAVAYFEIGNRIAAQARQLVVMPTQALLPVFAVSYVSNRARFEEHFATSMVHLAIFAGGLTVLVIMAAPLISLVMIEKIDPQLVAMIAIAVVGWMANALSAPAFLAAIGANISRWNMLGQGAATLAAPIAIWALADLGSAPLAAAGGMAMLAAGAVLMTILNCRSLAIRPWPTSAQFANGLRQLRFHRQ